MNATTYERYAQDEKCGLIYLMLKIFDCLKDCNACCCKSKELTFPFSKEEAEKLILAGSILRKINSAIGTLYQLEKCAFLIKNECLLHNKKEQPKCCQETKPGSPTCLYVRKNVF